jgi:hypothetical protein
MISFLFSSSDIVVFLLNYGRETTLPLAGVCVSLPVMGIGDGLRNF